MRKLLLAATAMIGATAGLATMANAQVVPPAVVVTPPPNPSSGAGLPTAGPLPGTAVVRLNVRIVADFMVGGGSDNGYKNPTTGITSKYAPYYFGEYARLYPAFDGVTQNGIKYGASAEIRQNSGGIGINQAFANNNGTAGNTLFWRRETMYVGTDRLGTLRFGQTDGVQSLFIVGTFENFDYEGGWDGDLARPVQRWPVCRRRHVAELELPGYQRLVQLLEAGLSVAELRRLRFRPGLGARLQPDVEWQPPAPAPARTQWPQTSPSTRSRWAAPRSPRWLVRTA